MGADARVVIRIWISAGLPVLINKQKHPNGGGWGAETSQPFPPQIEFPRDILTAPCCECVWVFKME